TANVAFVSPDVVSSQVERLAETPPAAAPDSSAEGEALEQSGVAFGPLLPDLVRPEVALPVEPGPEVAVADRWPTGGLHPHEIATLPILMYHHINVVPPTSTDLLLKDLTVSPLNFKRQLEYLDANAVQTVSLANLMSYLQG